MKHLEKDVFRFSLKKSVNKFSTSIMNVTQKSSKQILSCLFSKGANNSTSENFDFNNFHGFSFLHQYT